MIIDHNFHAMTMVIIYDILVLMDNIFHTYFVHDPYFRYAESYSTIPIVLIFNILKFGHHCSVVDDPNARDNLMQAYGCQSGKTNSSHKKNYV